MRRRLNLWIVVLTTAVTFGSLTAFVGHPSFGHRYGWYGGHRGYYGPMYRYGRGNCDGPNDKKVDLQPEQKVFY